MDMKKVNVMLVASGSGTDADAIMQAWVSGCIPHAHISVLVITKNGAGCIEKAVACGVEHVVIDRKEYGSDEKFNLRLGGVAMKYKIDLIFLVGCVVRIFADDFDIPIYNIHPADTDNFGGDGMYGLEVHERVILNAVDQINRGKKVLGKDRFFTFPTVHEVVLAYDSGTPLLIGAVEIPQKLLQDLIEEEMETLDSAAKELQKIVLPYEWLMLPIAVNMAVRRILDEE
jgi:folate-dependent phosphoribosylglycinamide formyltransferase PurN